MIRWFSLVLLMFVGAACSNEAARRAEQLEHERQLARIEVEKKQQLLELETQAERRRAQQAAEAEQQRAREQAEADRQRAAQASQIALQLAQQQTQAADARIRDAVAHMELSTRKSIVDETTQVLIMRNIEPYSVDLNLRCFNRAGTAKTLFVSVPARGTKEVGWLEGWDGNFVTGERCEMLYEQVKLREFSIR